MKITRILKKAIIVYFIVVAFSFCYGGIYTEMIKEGLSISFINIMFAVGGALVVGIPFFILAFILVFLYYWIKEKYLKPKHQ